jgi:hypothetical protein
MDKFGYRPDPPKSTDKDFSTLLRPKLIKVTDGDVDLREYCTASEQYSLGACAGNATADSVEITNAIEGKPPVQLSRLFVYTLARNMVDEDGDGRSDIDKDEGTYLRLCFDVLAKFGICREDLPAGQGGWPYDLAKAFTLPDLKAMRAATAHRIHSYYRIYEIGSNRIDAMVDALRGRHPVVFGTIVDQSFMDLSDDTPWSPSGLVVGGHAMVVVGYLQALGFIVKNSWGSDWGANGFCIMKPEVFTSIDTSDIWVPTSGTIFR